MRRWHFGAAALSVAIGCGDDGRSRGNPFTGSVGSIGDSGITGVGTAEGGDDDGSSDGTDDGGADHGTDGGTEGMPADAVPAAGIGIGRVEGNQAVGILLADAGSPIAPAARNGELVYGRTTLVQAEWVITGSAGPRMIEAQLELLHSDGSTEVLSDEKQVGGAADLASMDSSFAWELAPEQVTPGLRYRIRLLEADGVSRDGSTDGAVFPAAEAGDLGIAPERMEMELVLIPVTTPEGAPNLDPASVAIIEERMRAAYPLQELEVRVRAPWVRNARLSNLDEAFNYMSSARMEDGEGSGPYYHLILDNSTCCSGADYEGWAGIANLVDTSPYAQPREGITKLYPEYDDFMWDVATVIHEVGHNHGRDHAPCGDPGGPDPAYPYQNAALGARGYDIADGTIIDPVAVDPAFGMPHTDFMSYCFPQWWSDYSWRALVERVRLVTALPAAEPEDGYRWRLRGFARDGAAPTWSWVRVPGTARIDAGGGTLTVRGDDGSARDVPVRVSQLADAEGVQLLEADPDASISIAELELRLPDGAVRRTAGTSIVVAP